MFLVACLSVYRIYGSGIAALDVSGVQSLGLGIRKRATIIAQRLEVKSCLEFRAVKPYSAVKVASL